MSIVCCTVDDKIRVASDSIIVWGYTQDKSKDKYSKLCQVNGMIIGSVGLCEESAMLQIYASTCKPVSATELSLLNFMADFAEWKKKKTDKYIIENDNIIAFDGKVFELNGLFVKEIINYSAIGAGRDYALATLYLGNDVETAVKTACELSIYCELPVKVYEMEIK
jgi:ATP-dependent protease HslVU (ClpYQ) peptidase subunit